MAWRNATSAPASSAGIASGAGSYLVAKLSLNSIDDIARKTLQSLVPEERRGRVSMFMDSQMSVLADSHAAETLSLPNLRRLTDHEVSKGSLIVQIWDGQGQLLTTSYPSLVVPLRAENGFEDVQFGTRHWRVYAIHTPERTVQAVQCLEFRDMVISKQAFQAGLPIAQIDAAFTAMARDRTDALFIGGEALFASRGVQIATLAVRDRLPASFPSRELVQAGLLMSYGTNLIDMARQVGIYTGSILKGAKPADLPVLQSTKFEFVINLQTARSLNLDIPPTLLARADEVIE